MNSYKYVQIKTTLFLVIIIALVLMTSCAAKTAPTTEQITAHTDENTDYYRGLPVKYYDVTYAVNVEDYGDLSDNSDYVFVGKVVSYNGEYYREPLHSDEDLEKLELHGIEIFRSPFTKYTVEVLESLKGELTGLVDILKDSGLDQSGDYYLLNEGDFFPEEGETYIFFAIAQKDGSIVLCGKNANTVYSEETLDEVKKAINEQ